MSADPSIVATTYVKVPVLLYIQLYEKINPTAHNKYIAYRARGAISLAFP